MAGWLRHIPVIPAWLVVAAIATTMASFGLRWWWWYRPMPPAARAQYLAVALSMAPLLFFYSVVWAAESSQLDDLITLYRPLSRWAMLSLCAGQIINSAAYRVLVGDIRQWIGRRF